jgi:methionyl aminopeptidase
VVAITLKKMQAYAKVGLSTRALDDYGQKILLSFGAKSAPQKDYNFPGWNCISVNHEVCHGIPRPDRILKDGDLVNIDVSAELNGFYGDNGCSFVLGNDIKNLNPLVTASRDILNLAITQIKSFVKIAAVGGFIEKEARKKGYQVIKNLCGHGIGRKLHESPHQIACFRDRFNKKRFKKNGVIALETFISTRANHVYIEDDGWTYTTRDDGYVAQHEHTIIVTDGTPVIVTKENGI